MQRKLKKVKALIIKQQKRIKIVDKEENGWKVVKYYLSDGLDSNLEDEKQLHKARRKAVLINRNGKLTNIRTKRNSFGMPPLQEKH